jgi:hypothetical protein
MAVFAVGCPISSDDLAVFSFGLLKSRCGSAAIVLDDRAALSLICSFDGWGSDAFTAGERTSREAKPSRGARFGLSDGALSAGELDGPLVGAACRAGACAVRMIGF